MTDNKPGPWFRVVGKHHGKTKWAKHIGNHYYLLDGIAGEEPDTSKLIYELSEMEFNTNYDRLEQ